MNPSLPSSLPPIRQLPTIRRRPVRSLRPLRTLALLALFATTIGCVEKRVRQSLYLEASGGVTWEVIEDEVRSTLDEVAEREEEERQYLSAAAAARHPIADGLSLLHPYELRTEILRDRRPYAIHTVARYSDLEQTVARYLWQLGIVAEVELEESATGAAHPRQREITVLVDLDATRDEQRLREATQGVESESGVDGLVELWPELAETRIVLEQGRFLDGRGFDLDGPIARLRKLDLDVGDRELVLSLRWSHSDRAR